MICFRGTSTVYTHTYAYSICTIWFFDPTQCILYLCRIFFHHISLHEANTMDYNVCYYDYDYHTFRIKYFIFSLIFCCGVAQCNTALSRFFFDEQKNKLQNSLCGTWKIGMEIAKKNGLFLYSYAFYVHAHACRSTLHRIDWILHTECESILFLLHISQIKSGKIIPNVNEWWKSF